MKKINKTTKTPAPAKTTQPVVRKAPTAPAVKKTAPKTIATLISAHVDVGFGNLLYLRGEGPGLNWDTGILMECVADDRWSIELPESSRPIVFKFVLNDELWNIGENYTITPGTNLVLRPEF